MKGWLPRGKGSEQETERSIDIPTVEMSFVQILSYAIATGDIYSISTNLRSVELPGPDRFGVVLCPVAFL